MKKPKTNRQILTQMIKELDDIDLVFVRERLLAVADAVVNNQEQIREQMKDSFVHPHVYISAMERVKEKIGFSE